MMRYKIILKMKCLNTENDHSLSALTIFSHTNFCLLLSCNSPNSVKDNPGILPLYKPFQCQTLRTIKKKRNVKVVGRCWSIERYQKTRKIHFIR